MQYLGNHCRKIEVYMNFRATQEFKILEHFKAKIVESLPKLDFRIFRRFMVHAYTRTKENHHSPLVWAHSGSPWKKYTISHVRTNILEEFYITIYIKIEWEIKYVQSSYTIKQNWYLGFYEVQMTAQKLDSHLYNELRFCLSLNKAVQ